MLLVRSVAIDLLFHCSKSWRKNISLPYHIHKPPFIICHIVIFLPLVTFVFFTLRCPRTLALNPKYIPRSAKYPGAKQTKLHSFCAYDPNYKSTISGPGRLPAAWPQHFLGAHHFCCRLLLLFVLCFFLLTLLETCADAILFPPSANRARRALSEQIASRPHIRIRRCTVVYQKPSGEFCKYYINKTVSFNTA